MEFFPIYSTPILYLDIYMLNVWHNKIINISIFSTKNCTALFQTKRLWIWFQTPTIGRELFVAFSLVSIFCSIFVIKYKSSQQRAWLISHFIASKYSFIIGWLLKSQPWMVCIWDSFLFFGLVEIYDFTICREMDQWNYLKMGAVYKNRVQEDEGEKQEESLLFICGNKKFCLNDCNVANKKREGRRKY